METRRIGTIYNYYGVLQVKADADGFWWGIEDYKGTRWEEIPEYLYRALIQFEEERQT